MLRHVQFSQIRMQQRHCVLRDVTRRDNCFEIMQSSSPKITAILTQFIVS